MNQNETDAQTLLLNMSGSLSGINESFNSAPPPALDFRSYQNKVRWWQQREFSVFFKDDLKWRPGLTLNLGLRYEFYGVPYEQRGQTAGILGGSSGLFGISGTGFSDLYQPFRQDPTHLTQIQLVGKNSPNPDTLIYNNDLNNFAPAVGLSWSLPYFGKDKTVLRMGYSVGYERSSLRMFRSSSEISRAHGHRVPAVDRLRFDEGCVPAPLGKPLETVSRTRPAPTRFAI